MKTFVAAYLSLFLVSCVSSQASREPAFVPTYKTVELLKHVLQPEVRLLYVADSDHLNPKVKAALHHVLQTAVAVDKDINCLLLESDRKLYQPYIDKYQKGLLSWENSIEKADAEWRQLTGRPYRQTQAIYDAAIALGLNIQAVDWDDSSEQSELMTRLFTEGFQGKNLASLQRAFQIGVTDRNKVMGQNIRNLMSTQSPRRNVCKKAIMLVGGLHLVHTADMTSENIGVQKFKPITAFTNLSKNQQAIVGVYDCQTKLNMEDEAVNLCPLFRRAKEKNEFKLEDLKIESFGVSQGFPLNTEPAASGTLLINY